MRGDQPPAGERQAGGGVCGEVECRKIFPDQRPYEPEVPIARISATPGKTQDDQFL